MKPVEVKLRVTHVVLATVQKISIQSYCSALVMLVEAETVVDGVTIFIVCPDPGCKTQPPIPFPIIAILHPAGTMRVD